MVEHKLEYQDLPPTRKDLGYEWTPKPVSYVLDAFSRFLERNNAKAYLMDVYASNDSVYRNLLIQLPKYGIFEAENIYFQFNRDDGRQYTLKIEERR
jgi:hypothetical protein